jgi:hypothetical protein
VGRLTTRQARRTGTTPVKTYPSVDRDGCDRVPTGSANRRSLVINELRVPSSC